MTEELVKSDAVITWVNGSDPEFISNKNKYLASEYKSFDNILGIGVAKTRFENIGEIYYCIKLIRKNLEWIENIYLVTNGQIPELMSESFLNKYRVKIITHDQIFLGYESYLPVFNSRSIEAMLTKIPGISDNFLYFNDDFFVLKKIPFSFFKTNEIFNVRGSLRFKNLWLDRIYRAINFKFKKGSVGYRYETIFYPKKFHYFSPAHSPYFIDKRKYDRAIDLYGGVEKIIKYRFRNNEQAWPIGIYYNYLAKKNKLKGCGKGDWEYLKKEKDIYHYCVSSMNEKKVKHKLVCMQSLDECGEITQAKFHEYMEWVISQKY